MSQRTKQQSISSFFAKRPATEGASVKPKKQVEDPVQEPLVEGEDSLVDTNDGAGETESPYFAFSQNNWQYNENEKPASITGTTKAAAKPDTGLDSTSEARSGPETTDQHEIVTRVQVQASASERTAKYLYWDPTDMPNGPPQEEDPEIRRQNEILHAKFVQRLGRPDSLFRKRQSMMDQEELDGADPDQDEDEDGEDEPPAKKQKTAKGAARRTKDKLTPLERQVIEIKRQNPDTLLIVEVGYKFRFFGEDARAAARELNIMCFSGKMHFDERPSEAHLDRFASASVPVHRLQVHVKRLVSAGYKVGVVRQLETAALKAAGSNRNTTFERGLTNLYTKGTYIDDQEGLEMTSDVGEAPATGHLLCMIETMPKGWGSDEKVHIGLVAVQPATGDIIYDDFEDGWMRSELETRLLHIAPCEFLLIGEGGSLSKATEKLVKHLSASKRHIFGDSARVERIDKPKTMAAEAHSHLTKFYADKMKEDLENSTPDSSQGALLDKIHKLSENVTICLSALIKHLTAYKLEHVFDLTKYFQSFSGRSHMMLNGNTLNSLELYRNQTDFTSYGSLFWVLDRTKTRFGQRLLRKWIGRPLLDPKRLHARLEAVEELTNNQTSAAVSRLETLLGKIRTDLERSLIRIYYKKCGRSEMLASMQTLQMIAQEYAHVKSAQDAAFRSPLLSEAIAALPRIADDVVKYLERINAVAAKADDPYDFFREEWETEEITNHKVGIIAVEHDLEEYLKVAADLLKRKKVSYVTVAAVDFLIELDNTTLKNVPASWMKMSGTKKVSRYHSPEIVQLVKERDQHKEALTAACNAAYMDLLEEIGGQYQLFRDCVQSLAELDCLQSLAEVASQPGYCKPEFVAESGISIKGGRHPMIEQLILDTFVPNDVDLDAENTRALLVTGPNAGGKSSYVRSVALITVMAQIGSYVPAESAKLGLVDAVFTRMGAFDNMMKGESTFMVEISETADILKQATPRSLIILDELGRGTSTYDGVAIADAVLDYVMTELKSFTLFITHYQALTKMAARYEGHLKNVYMRFSENDDGVGGQNITFLYEVGDGVAHRSYGLNVARLVGLPDGLIQNAYGESKKMEEQEKLRQMQNLARLLTGAMTSNNSENLDRFVQGVERL